MLLASSVPVAAGLRRGGPVSRYEGLPDKTFDVPLSAGDVERCLIQRQRFPGVIIPYRQPDRPAEVILVYYFQDTTIRRVDIRAAGSATSKVSAWNPPDELDDCIIAAQ